jgi:hypothetical protein
MLQHDLPPLMRGRNGPRLMATTQITPCAFHPEWRNSGAFFAAFRSSEGSADRQIITPPAKASATTAQNAAVKARMVAPPPVC